MVVYLKCICLFLNEYDDFLWEMDEKVSFKDKNLPLLQLSNQIWLQFISIQTVVVWEMSMESVTLEFHRKNNNMEWHEGE